MDDAAWDVVLRGGRVIDPESGTDAIAEVAVAGDRIAQIRPGLPTGRIQVDVAGLVVMAGFIDLHSRVTDVAGLRLQALDGLTTALELEAGLSPVAAGYQNAAAEGRPVNYGFATSWAHARMQAFAGIAPPDTLTALLASVADPAWQRPAGRAQLSAMLAALSADLLDEDDPADRRLLMRSRAFPGAVVASDAMPLTWTKPPPEPLGWPLPRTAVSHPRTAGRFCRALRLITSGEAARRLPEALEMQPAPGPPAREPGIGHAPQDIPGA